MVPEGEPRVWSIGRKLIPNLLPLLVGLPFWVAAVILGRQGTMLDGIILGAFGLLVSAVSLNWLGMVGNEQMRSECISRLRAEQESIFIGISNPGYTNLLDPHQDIGFLTIKGDALVIRGERIHLQFLRASPMRFGFANNPHSALGLGRWLTIESGRDSDLVRVFIEPRERGSLRANRALGTELRMRLETWARG